MPENCDFPGIQGDICRNLPLCILFSKIQNLANLDEEQIMTELNSVETDSNNGCACGPEVRKQILEYLRSINSQ